MAPYLVVDDDCFGCEVPVDEFGRLVQELETLSELRESLLDLDLVEFEFLVFAGPVRRGC